MMANIFYEWYKSSNLKIQFLENNSSIVPTEVDDGAA